MDMEAILILNPCFFFHEHNILVIKEEGDTSQVSQAYNQLVAKEDKKWVSGFLDIIKIYRKKVVNQWDVIIVISKGFNKVAKGKAWRTPFIMVNLCPLDLISFKDRLESWM